MAHNRPDTADIYPWKSLPLTDSTRIAEIEGLTALEHVESAVWCDKYECVHDTGDGFDDPCDSSDHRALYMEMIPSKTKPVPSLTGEDRRMMDDLREQIEAAPVRSNPVPLNVRRHTSESRQIWFDNLRAALPADLLDEDKDRITNALLETTIQMGNELRRKRLIDKLMQTAEEMEEMSPSAMARRATRANLMLWSELLADAAEEIRSIL